MNNKSRQCSRPHDVNTQVTRMLAFIAHEAQERSDEMDHVSEGDCNYVKGNAINQGYFDVQRAYEKKERLVIMREQTYRATKECEARLRLLACREAHIATVAAEVQERLMRRLVGEEYHDVLYKLLLQGVCRLLEQDVVVRVREQDAALVEQLFPRAREYYSRVVGAQLRLALDTSVRLPPSCLGGVDVATPSRRICVDNTLLARIQMIVRQLVPAIKHCLFDS